MRDACGPALVIEVGIDLVRDHQQLMAAGDLGERGQLGVAAVHAGRIVRVVEYQKSRDARVGTAVFIERARQEFPFVFERRWQPGHPAADDSRLRRVGDPGRTRHEQLAGIGQLSHEDEFLGARPDQHLAPRALDAMTPVQEFGHFLAQRPQAAHGQVVLLGRCAPQSLHHAAGHRERRLAETELEHLASLGDELVAAFVDGERRGWRQAEDVGVEMR